MDKKQNLRKILLATVACCTMGCAMAEETSVSLYGVVGLYGGRIKRSNAPATELLGQGGLTTSYIGFGGKEDLGGGLSAVFALEAFFQPDNGNMGRSAADPFFSRNSYLGLQSGLGRVTFGRQTNPTYVNMGLVSAFGGSTVFSPLVLQSFVGSYANAIVGDTVWDNAIEYASPRVNGFSFTGLYSLGEVADRSGVANVGLHGNYIGHNLTVVASAQRVRTTVVAPMTEQVAYFGGAAYDFKFVKLFGALERTRSDGLHNETRTHSLGARVPTSASGSVLAEWAQTKRQSTQNTERTTASLGYDYFLSKRTDVYTIFSRDKLTGFSGGNSVAVGVRHSF